MKREHGKLMRIKDIYSRGKFNKVYEKEYFEIDGNLVNRIRVFGTVVQLYRNTEDKKYVSLTLDDGSDTIRLKLWSNPIKNTDGSIYDPYEILDGVQIGDLIDVIARVRQWEEEWYLLPTSAGITNDISLEINRRAVLASEEIESKGLNPLKEDPVIESEDTYTNLQDQILSLFKNKDKDLTLDEIVSQIPASKDQIEVILDNLISEAFILQVSMGVFKAI